LGFSWSIPFQSGECLILSTNVTIFSQQWYHSGKRMAEENSLETQATPRGIQRKQIALFRPKTTYNSLYTCRACLISCHCTSFSSHLPNVLCWESPFHHTENYMRPSGKQWVRFR
jgi:hypothetical protein